MAECPCKPENDHNRTALLIFVAIFLAFSTVLCIRQLYRQGDLITSDGIGYFSHLPSILVDGDVDYRNNLERFGISRRNHWPIGTAISWSGPYLLGYGVSLVKEGFELQTPQGGHGFPEQLACCLATIAYGAAAVALTYLLLVRWFEPLPSLIAVFGLFAGTNLWYYLLCEPYMSHGVSTFWVTVILYLGLRDEALTAKQAALIGVAGGMAALTRPQDGLALVVPILWHLGQHRNQLRKTLGLLLFSGFLAVGLFSPQLTIWQAQIAPPSGIVADSTPPALQGKAENLLHIVPGGGHNWASPQFRWALLNLHSGLWTWHPLTALALGGLLLYAARKLRLSLTLLTGYLILLYMVAAWTGQGQSFGGRMMCSTFAFLATGLAYLCTLFPKTIKVLVIVAALLNLIVALRYRLLIVEAGGYLKIWEIIGLY